MGDDLKTRKINFINKANKIHNNQYDYSKVIYVNNSTNVEIICKKHGSFFVRPNDHTSKKRYCPHCTQETQSDSIDFVRQEIEKRGGLLLNSMSDDLSYIKTEQRIEVKCCGCEKVWTPKWRTIKINNRWCGICNKKYSKSMTFDELRDLAKKEKITITKFPNNPIPKVLLFDLVNFKCDVCNAEEQKTVRCFVLNSRSNGKTCSNCSSRKNSIKKAELITDLKNHGFSIIEDENDPLPDKLKYDDEITIRCSKGHVQNTNLTNIISNGLKRHGKPPCGECRNLEASERCTYPLDLFLEKCKEKYGDKYDYSLINNNWKGKKHKIPVICKTHGVWECHPEVFLNRSKYGCPKCGTFEGAKKQTFTHEEYVENLRKKNNKITCVGEYVNSHTKVLHKCNVCDHEWKVIPASLIQNGTGCPECGKKYYRELWVREVLIEIFKENFVSARPEWLRNTTTNRKMELDCYSKKLGLAVEYQGKQHYESNAFWGGEESFDAQLQRDKIKNNLCLMNNVILWRIDSRKFSKLREQEFKKAIRKEINNFALCKIRTPIWNKNSEFIRKMVLNI